MTPNGRIHTRQCSAAAVAVLTAAALAAPAAAFAHADGNHAEPPAPSAKRHVGKPTPGETAHAEAPAPSASGRVEARGRNKAKRVTFVFRGMFTDRATITVTAGNAHVRKGGFVGRDVTFSLAAATVVVADVNGDGLRDLADVRAGDAVLVQARLPLRTADDATPIAASRLIVRSSDASDDDPAEAPAATGMPETRA